MVLCALSLAAAVGFEARRWLAAANLVISAAAVFVYPDELWASVVCGASLVVAGYLSILLLR